MKRSSQRRIKRWVLEELTRRLDQRNEGQSDRSHIHGPHRSGLSSIAVEGTIEDHSWLLLFTARHGSVW
jgi:hypothetical protein